MERSAIIPPIVVYRPLVGPVLTAFNLMVDAMRLLDAAGEAGAATDLAAAINQLVHVPQQGDADIEADRRLLDRMDVYFECVAGADGA